MATYYVSKHKSASDTNAGTSVGAAWATLHHAASTVADGDTIVVLDDGIHTTSTEISFNTAAQEIAVVGADASGNIGAARPVIRATSIQNIMVNTNRGQQFWFQDFDGDAKAAGPFNASLGVSAVFCRFRNSLGSGAIGPSGNGNFAFCSFESNSSRGLDGGRLAYQCISIDNSSDGFYYVGSILNCVAINNSSSGFVVSGESFCINCTAAGNTNRGFHIVGDSTPLIGCVSVNNDYGYLTGYTPSHTRNVAMWGNVTGSGSAANTSGGFSQNAELFSLNEVTGDPDFPDIVGTLPADIDVRPLRDGPADDLDIDLPFDTGEYASTFLAGAAWPEPPTGGGGGVFLPFMRIG